MLSSLISVPTYRSINSIRYERLPMKPKSLIFTSRYHPQAQLFG